MLDRCFDAERINRVVNHPEVRPFIGDPDAGELDVTKIAAQPKQWFLMGDHGGFLLAWSQPRVREVHTFILPEGRGRWASKARKSMLDYARANGTKRLWTKIPPDAPHVAHFARQGGMQSTDKVIQTFGSPYRVYMMELR